TRWAEIELDGRDATLKGKTTNAAPPEAAAKIVAAVAGVRKVTAVAVVEPLTLVAPTVESLEAQPPVTEIKGTWPEGVAKTLAVTVGGKTYSLPGSAELSSSNGNWLLKLPAALDVGSHEVSATASVESDGATVSQASKAPGKITVLAPPPPPEPPATPDTAPEAAPAPTPEPESPGNQGAAEPVPPAVQPASTDATPGTQTAEAGAGSTAAAPQPPAEPAPAPSSQSNSQSNSQSDSQPEPQPESTAAPLAAPTVERQLDLTGAPLIRGTWPEGEGTTLTIALAGKTYELGVAANLSRDGTGRWKLLPASALKDGIHDVVVTVKKGSTEAKDQSLAELEVDATPPSAPTVKIHASDVAPASVDGTFDAKRTTSLNVSVPELPLSAELGGAGSALTADGESWTLAMPKDMKPGTYNIVVTATDKRGRSVEDASAGEIVISAPQEAAPKTDGQFDCEAAMTRISSVFPMRFIFARTDFQERFGLSVSQYAALLKDTRCGKLNVEVGGHADERGSDSYNEDLAEHRAIRVRDMLVEAGVAAGRLSVASYGESVPLNPGHEEEAWSVNRRVEIRIVK
ncbi:MAG: OmpA family protein, partial [Rhizobiales bacterium]|nr:OmpA family protein [Hyphomicrobiales bacterium]